MIASQLDDMHRMTRAMYRYQKWIHAVQPSGDRLCSGEFFPDISADILSAAAARYVELGVWGKDPHLPREVFERLRDARVRRIDFNSAPNSKTALTINSQTPLSQKIRLRLNARTNRATCDEALHPNFYNKPLHSSLAIAAFYPEDRIGLPIVARRLPARSAAIAHIARHLSR